LVQIDKSSINLTISNSDYYVTPVDIASYNLKIDNIDYKPIIVDTGLFTNKFNDITFILPYFDINQNVIGLNEINKSLSVTVDSMSNKPTLNQILSSDIGLILDISPFNLNLNEILNLFVYTDQNEFNVNVNNVLHEPTLIDRIQYSNSTNQILHNLTLSDKFNLSNKLNDILIKYDSFPATFRNKINELSYIQNSTPVYIDSNLNNLSYELSKESTINSNNLNNLSYDISKESSTNSNNLKNLLYELSQERTDYTLSTNNLNYNLSKEVIDFDLNTSLIYNYTPEIINYNVNTSLTYLIDPIDTINFRLSTSLNNVYTPEILTFNLKPQIDYTSYNETLNYNLALNDLKYTTLDTFKNVNERIEVSIDIIYNQEKSSIFQSLRGTELYSTTSDQATASKISFVPYDSSSNLTFNSSSLRHYVRQINEVFYMSGSQLTSSRIDYQDDIEIIIMGKGSTTTYKDNLDYNIPYKASFSIKNWPHYQYNTSSYWYLPVILNTSTDDIYSSSDIWVTASFQNGTDVFTDQYGFAIDI
jgi:hypothetical protein